MHDASGLRYLIDTTLALCRIPSPAGYTAEAEAFLEAELRAFGCSPSKTRKRSVLCDLGGTGRPLVLAAHVDTLGAMVRSVKPNGRLRITKLGGYPDAYILGETCLVHTRKGRRISGTIQAIDASAHVNPKIRDLKYDEDSLELLLDEKVHTRDEVLALGVSAGDPVSLDPRSVETEKGFLKSRHLDDKAGAAILLGLARAVSRKELALSRKTYLLFTTYEEVGHGGAYVPDDAEEVISVDMGAVGDDLGCDEFQVSICAKDSKGPYDREVLDALVRAARRADCAFSVDIYPMYTSDVDAALAAGRDIRHGLIGPGVYASHGYERTHAEALGHSLALLAEYLRA